MLFIGELRAIKGIEFLIDALAELNLQRPVTATIVGSGPSTDALKAKVAALGLVDRITFTGALPARDAFSLGRVMVVPSLAESFPYVVLEAAAAGLPLISTDVGGIPEIVAGTDTALIPPGSVPSLVSALNATLADPEAARAKALRLRANVERKFTVAGMTTRCSTFYAINPVCKSLIRRAMRAALTPLGTDNASWLSSTSNDDTRVQVRWFLHSRPRRLSPLRATAHLRHQIRIRIASRTRLADTRTSPISQ